MDYFDMLPHDKLVEFCESLDTQELSRLSMTSKRIKEECQFVIDERKGLKIIEFKENTDQILASIRNTDSNFERQQKLSTLFDYLERYYPFIRRVYTSMFISNLINQWIVNRYQWGGENLERFRPLIEKLNKYFNVNYDLNHGKIVPTSPRWAIDDDDF